MKILWCWRCKQEVPMLDEAEYEIVVANQFKKAVEELGSTGSDERVQQRILTLVSAEYERLTGIHISDPWHVFRHVQAGFGPPCTHCGKPLRTARARLCGACMAPVRDNSV